MKTEYGGERVMKTEYGGERVMKTEYGGVYTETHRVLDNETMITRPSLSGGSR